MPRDHATTSPLEDASALREAGDFDQALNALQPLLDNAETPVKALSLAGAILLENKHQPGKALPLLERACFTDPESQPHLLKLADCLLALDRPRQALDILLPASAAPGASPDILERVARAYLKDGQKEEGLQAWQALIEGKSATPAHLASYAEALRACGRIRECLNLLQDATVTHPDSAALWKTLGETRSALGEMPAAVLAFESASKLAPEDSDLYSSILFTCQTVLQATTNDFLRTASRWESYLASSLPAKLPTHPNNPDPDRRLRVGYVSPDFRWHSVAFFFEPLLLAHDRDQFEIFCYSNSRRNDTMTDHIREHTDHWRDISTLDDEKAAALVQEDKIDLLVDLAGYTFGNRLALFARRPAPLQLAGQGYPGSRFMKSIDYWMTDDIADPPGESFPDGIGQPLPIAEGYHVFCPDPEAQFPVSPPPCERHGVITFGTFNQHWKIHPETVALWARVMKKVPGSRMLLKSTAFQHPEVLDRYLGLFENEGITRDRIRCLGSQHVKRRHFELYGQIDISLDTFPYHGTTTTCEAWWMGVPVVVLNGTRNAARVGTSLLHQMEMADEWSADSETDFVRIAVAAARDPQTLSELRHSLRDRLLQSTLGDPARYARNQEAAFRKIWHRWCSTGGA